MKNFENYKILEKIYKFGKFLEFFFFICGFWILLDFRILDNRSFTVQSNLVNINTHRNFYYYFFLLKLFCIIHISKIMFHVTRIKIHTLSLKSSMLQMLILFPKIDLASIQTYIYVPVRCLSVKVFSRRIG